MTLANVVLLLVLAAFLITVASAAGKAPLWAAVLLLTVISLIQNAAR